jgi:tetratricopeptide (TPR) repeat protein
MGTEWKAVILIGLLSFCGASFYFYEAISGMTNPPMEWGYPRTVEGFWHALSRGQYEKINPTDVFKDPGHFMIELGMLVTGLADAFSWVAMFFAVLPFLFLLKMKKRERSWIIIIGAIYPFLGVLLAITLNPTRERQTADLVKVFFTASHAIVALLIGYGLALSASFMATNYQRFRRWGLAGAGVGVALALYSLTDTTAKHYFGLSGELDLASLPHWIAQSFAPAQFGSPVIASLGLLLMTLVFMGAVFFYRDRAPLGIALGLFALLPVYSGMSHWFHSEQHNHWFGYWFGHDMFTPPFVGPDGNLTYDSKLREAAAKGPHGTMVYPEMARDAVLYGGTDPGRFCPTYTIFCESFIPHVHQPDQDQNYDRRDVYIITQNALADNTYLDYIRAQYNRSAQIDPPFFQNFLSGSLPSVFHGPARAFGFLDDIFEGLGAKVEKRRRTGTSWFTAEQITNPKALAGKLHKSQIQDPLSQYLYRRLKPETQHLVDAGGDESALRRALTEDLNDVVAGTNIYNADRFKSIKLPVLIEQAASEKGAAGSNLTANNVIRLNRRLLEEAYPDDVVKSLGGVYPDTEISTDSPEDSQECFNEYILDAQRRLQHDTQNPNEPPQLKGGEDVHIDNGRVQVAGQVAVMSINGLLTKVMFDKNPLHEFYVEESFPLDWMYPYLTPFGVIMKINRHQLPELTQDIVDKDHAFWSEYSRRMIGNWITYDTSVKQICDWAEDVYLRHDFSHFTGDRAFIRDDDAQKAFSKLRSSIGSSIYLWRARRANPKYPAEQARVTKEAEFALKQAFAYCPYSPEAVFHLMELLLTQNRIDDALAILQTCHKLDPYSGQINEWIDRLSRSKTAGAAAPDDRLKQAFAQVQRDISNNQTNAAEQMLEQILKVAGTDPNTLMSVASAYLSLGNQAKSDEGRMVYLGKSEEAVEKLTQLLSGSSEPFYNLAVIQAARHESAKAVASLKKSLALNAADAAKDPKAMDLRKHLFEDPTFVELRKTPEFQAAFGTKP